jgi:hypothetical protein
LLGQVLHQWGYRVFDIQQRFAVHLGAHSRRHDRVTRCSIRIAPPALHRTGFRETSGAVRKNQRVQRIRYVRHDNTHIGPAIGEELSNQMTADILPLFGRLKEPWQRVAVGFRLFLLRALLDPTWAAYVTRVDAWPHNTLVARYMVLDLRNGKENGQFHFERIDAVSDFLRGATAHTIQAIVEGVDDPNQYMDASLRMALTGLDCPARLCEQAVTFSLTYLQTWAAGTTDIPRPKWIDKIDSEDGQRFPSYQPSNRTTPDC